MRTLMIPLFLVAAAVPAFAQDKKDGLTPTDVLEFAQITVTGSYRGTLASASLTQDSAGIDIDLESVADSFGLDLALGLPFGFEVEAHILWQFNGGSEGDGNLGAAEYESKQEVDGFGDLEIDINYALIKEGVVLPHWMIGIIYVAPTGDDKEGEAEQTVNGVQVTNDEDGAIGEGVWKFGLSTGLSKKISIAEVYALTSYVWGGTRTKNGIDEDAADKWTIIAGVEIHFNEYVRLDPRVFLQHVGESEKEEYDDVLGVYYQAQEESYWAYGFQASLYVKLGMGFTGVLSGGAYLAQDHEANDYNQLEIEDLTAYFFQVGLHFFLGPKGK